MKRLFPLFLAFSACTPALSREMIRNHPRIKVTVIEPQVVERSAPFAPPWTLRPDRGAVAYVSFTGQASGTSMDSAKGDAERDLFASIASFISVEVESESESVEREANGQGSFEARSLTRTKTGAALEGVKPDEVYWEKRITSPLAPDDAQYRYHVYAKVPKDEISRARLKKLLARKDKSGKTLIVVLPFRPSLSTPDLEPLAQAFAEELSRKLALAPNVQVSDAGLVRALLATSRVDSEAEALETIRDGLLPDVIIAGGYQLHQSRLRVSFTIHKNTAPPVGRTFERAYSELFKLEDDLISAISAEVGLQSSAPVAPRDQTATALSAFEAYHAAFEQYRSGKNEAAIALLKKALQLKPGYGLAHLRLGRVLERIGRYGLVPPRTQGPRQRGQTWFREPCTSWSEISPEGEMNLREAASLGGAPASLPPLSAINVDHVLSAVAYLLRDGPMPEPPVPTVPDAAIGAYWNALRVAVVDQDPRLKAEALEALADLALRVDRAESSEQLHSAVHSWANSSGDLHFKSLSAYGLGRVARYYGQTDQAISWLKEALAARALLGEKPYLLEIFNELGGIEVERGDYASAYSYYDRARRLAEDLNDDYFRAVLGNNLAVLLLINGRAFEAERYFQVAWDYLKDLDEREGQTAAGLNVGHISALKADPERAQAYLREVQRIVTATGQEGRLAELYDHRGTGALIGGSTRDALRDLIRSWVLYDRVGRNGDGLRVRGNLLAADYYAWAEAGEQRVDHKARLNCLQDTMGDLLLRGYGEDRPGITARWFSHQYGHYGPVMYREPEYVHTNIARRAMSFMVATLNGETLVGLEP